MSSDKPQNFNTSYDSAESIFKNRRTNEVCCATGFPLGVAAIVADYAAMVLIRGDSKQKIKCRGVYVHASLVSDTHAAFPSHTAVNEFDLNDQTRLKELDINHFLSGASCILDPGHIATWVGKSESHILTDDAIPISFGDSIHIFTISTSELKTLQTRDTIVWCAYHPKRCELLCHARSRTGQCYLTVLDAKNQFKCSRKTESKFCQFDGKHITGMPDIDHGVVAASADRDACLLFRNKSHDIYLLDPTSASVSIASHYPSVLCQKKVIYAVIRDQFTYVATMSGIFVLDSYGLYVCHQIAIIGGRFSVSPSGNRMLAEDRYDCETLHLLE
jgi:hypothetical protein